MAPCVNLLCTSLGLIFSSFPHSPRTFNPPPSLVLKETIMKIQKKATASCSSHRDDLPPKTSSRRPLFRTSREFAERYLQESPQQPTESCPLFGLPAEVRNIIYSYVLDNAAPIVITAAGYSRNGGLLATNKRIRAEALGLFYGLNSFTHTTRDFDTRPLKRWVESMRGMPHGVVKVDFPVAFLMWEPNWENLMQWMGFLHQGFQVGYLSHETLEGTFPLAAAAAAAAAVVVIAATTIQRVATGLEVIAAMFETLREMMEQKQDWGKVERVLKLQRKVLGRIDGRWKEPEN